MRSLRDMQPDLVRSSDGLELGPILDSLEGNDGGLGLLTQDASVLHFIPLLTKGCHGGIGIGGIGGPMP